jgi:iron complex outermembrane receptor protein
MHTVTSCPATRLSLAISLALAAPALVQAQSTGTQYVERIEEVQVTGNARLNFGGVTTQNATKARVSVLGDSLLNQSSGQTFLDSLNQVPGFNFTNSDAYGSSGGNIRLRGFDGNRVSLTFDGIPLNDTGNYATYTNQMVDPELIDQVDVNLGTTDVDSPTASAIGGTINTRTRRPSEEAGGAISVSTGEDSFRRVFGRYDIGSFGPWGTRAWLSASHAGNDKFKGPGEMEKSQVNGMILQELQNGNFMSLAFHYNQNRNNFYRNTTENNWRQFGRDYDNLATCMRDDLTASVRDDDNAAPVAGTTALPANDNPANPSACTNFHGLRINPSNTGNLRGNSLWNLSDTVRLTIDPYFQYVLANGGGTGVFAETPAATGADLRIVGASRLAGFDINGDGDILDNVRLYTPNTTNTRRYGVNASLIWDLDDSQRLRFAYAWDYGKHRQTGAYGYVDAAGNPEDVFGGRNGRPVPTADGSVLRGRDRYSIAELNQFSAEYSARLFDDRMNLTIGLRAPFFERELNQYCYTQNGSGNVLCTTQAPSSTLANGNVRFGGSTTEYIAPFSAKAKFDDVLPNVGFTFALNDSNTLFASYAGGLSAPRTDNLYSVRRQTNGSLGRANPDPEESSSIDLGWRLRHEAVLASATLWRTEYKNRIVSSFDEELGFSVDRNVGDVELQGLDLQAGWAVTERFTLSGMASWNDSELQDNLRISATTVLPTAGKELVETPEWTYGLRMELNPLERLNIGLEGKWVDERYSTDLNDAMTDSYVLFHLNASYAFNVGARNTLLARLNVYNLFDEEFFGNISSTTGAVALPGFTPSQPNLALGAPRTASVSLQYDF